MSNSQQKRNKDLHEQIEHLRVQLHTASEEREGWRQISAGKDSELASLRQQLAVATQRAEQAEAERDVAKKETTGLRVLNEYWVQQASKAEASAGEILKVLKPFAAMYREGDEKEPDRLVLRRGGVAADADFLFSQNFVDANKLLSSPSPGATMAEEMGRMREAIKKALAARTHSYRDDGSNDGSFACVQGAARTILQAALSPSPTPNAGEGTVKP